mgnify:CR=1 FL=1
MKRPDCACKASGAYLCYRLRVVGPSDFAELDDEEDAECECGCHQRDEDGFSAWDSEDDRKAILEQQEKDRLADIAKYGVG